MRASLSSSIGPTELSQFLLVSIVVVVLVFSSGLVPGLSVTQAGPPGTVGDGNATVTSVTVDADSVRITPGRFGTAVSYVRVPDASVALADVTGAPRIVYRLEVPALGIEHDATRLVSGPGTLTVRLRDVAVRPDQVSADRYEGRLTVRVQSHTVDRVVRNESLTIEVEP